MAKDDVFASGDPYELSIGRWSRLVAAQFLDWLHMPPRLAWLDVGCGTGALTQAILSHATPASVTGIDSSEGFIEHSRGHILDPRATFQVGDAMALPFDGEQFDVVVSGLVLHFVPRPEVALSQMVQVAKRGGVIAIYVWDYAGEMQMLRKFWDAAVELDPAAIEKDQARRFPICKPQPLVQLFKGAGLTDIEVHTIDVPTRFRDFDDYWLPFLGGQGPAPGYVAALDEEARARLSERVRSKVPIAEDGSILMIARAWSVRGRK